MPFRRKERVHAPGGIIYEKGGDGEWHRIKQEEPHFRNDTGDSGQAPKPPISRQTEWKKSGALKRQISVGTILLVIIAFAAGVAGGSYFVSRPSENQIISTLTSVITAPTTITLTPTAAGSSVSSSVATSSAVQIQTSTSQRPKWISSSENVISWTQASSYVGQRKTVEGTIVYTYQSGSNVFLDFHYPYQGYFYIYIPSTGNFKFSPTSFYRNKEVRVTGTIVLYKGSPEIIVNSPSQIEVAYMGFNYP
jgi:hypothetical protein